MTVLSKRDGRAGQRARRAARRGETTRRGLIALSILAAAVVVLALVGPYITPHDPTATDSSLAFLGPSAEYPLGTDNLGRCMLSRILAGLSTSLVSAIAVVAFAFVIGTVLGALAGFFGGFVDRLVMWLITSFQVFPSFLLAVVVAGFLGPGIVNACIALVIVYWTTFARMSRSLVLALKERTFVKAAALNGCGRLKTLVRHIIPNISSYMLVIATGDIGSVILSMSGLSYLGLGAQRPTCDWGVMLSEFQRYVFNAPQLMLEVGICLSLVVLLFTLLGDRLRDWLDARGAGRGIGRASMWWRKFRRSRWGLLRNGELADAVAEVSAEPLDAQARGGADGSRGLPPG